MLATASLVLVAACSDDPKERAIPAAPTTTVGAPPSTQGDLDRTPRTAPNGEPLGDDRSSTGDFTNGHHLALLSSYDVEDRTITVDVVQWLDGAEASRAYAEDNNGDTIDGEEFYVRNQNSQLRTFKVSRDAVGLSHAVADPDRTRLTFAEFTAQVPRHGSNPPLVGITITAGTVARIEHIYTP